MRRNKMINYVHDKLGITKHLAKELLMLSGWDADLVIECSLESLGLDHCKADIINKRINRIS